MRVLSFFLFSLVSFGTTSALQLHEMTGTQWAPYVEWEFENDSFEGNPFDIIAKATFCMKVRGRRLRLSCSITEIILGNFGFVERSQAVGHFGLKAGTKISMTFLDTCESTTI